MNISVSPVRQNPRQPPVKEVIRGPYGDMINQQQPDRDTVRQPDNDTTNP